MRQRVYFLLVLRYLPYIAGLESRTVIKKSENK